MSTLKTHNLQSPDAGSVNIVMAPNAGMVVAGLSTYSNQINVGNNIKLGNAGVVTATSFVGGLPITSGADNRVITASSASAIQGESTLTYDGNDLQNLQTNAAANLILKATSNSFNSIILDSNRSASTQFGVVDGKWNGTVVNRIQFVTGTDGTNKDDGFMAFHTRESGQSLTERLRITSAGLVGIGFANPISKIGVEGTGNGSTGSVNLGDSAAAASLFLKTHSGSSVGLALGGRNTGGQYIQAAYQNATVVSVRDLCINPHGGGIGIGTFAPNFGGNPGADTIVLGTSQIERLRITSAGLVGIAHHVDGQIAKELTIRPGNDGGIRFVRPGETSASPNIHLDLTTTTSGSAFPSGEAYTVKYKTMNCDQIFETYEGGGTGGNISFRTRSSSGESLRIDTSGHVSLRNSTNSHQDIQWYSNTAKSASIGWGNGSANWEFKHYRNDNQADNPYANIDFFTGSTTSPTRALRITNDGNHIREKHSRFATRVDYSGGNEGANTKIPFKAAHVNVGGDYSDSNERFTAPVDGDYAFWFHTNVARSGSGSYYATWYRNGSEESSTKGGRMYDQHSGSGWNNLSGCIMLNLSEGDYVEIYNGGSVVNYDGNNYGQWMGWLVG